MWEDTLVPYLQEVHDERHWNFQSIATTDIVAHPQTYLKKRGSDGFSIFLPGVAIRQKVSPPCSWPKIWLMNSIRSPLPVPKKEKKLAQQAHGDEHNLLLLQPKETNDAGFAMTSSFTSMLLTALLVFDPSEEEIKENRVEELVHLSEQILEKDRAVKEVVDLDFERVIYLGSGPFFGLAHEAQLKILELTAGKIATMYESPVGFRHGPKSLINDQTLVLVFGSIDPYTRQYDLDLVREVAGDQIARQVVLLTDQAAGIEHVREVLVEASADSLDIYRAFPYIIYGQLISLLTSLKVQNRPDTPSPTGTVNRVVQGVIIHPFHKE